MNKMETRVERLEKYVAWLKTDMKQLGESMKEILRLVWSSKED